MNRYETWKKNVISFLHVAKLKIKYNRQSIKEKPNNSIADSVAGLI